MTTGTPSLTYATRLLVVPRSIPTTLLMPCPPGSACSSPAPFLSSRELPLDSRQQIVDVVALEHPFAERPEHGPALGLRGGLADERVPLGRQLVQLLFVFA